MHLKNLVSEIFSWICIFVFQKHIDWENCTYICRHAVSENDGHVESLPENTPCGEGGRVRKFFKKYLSVTEFVEKVLIRTCRKGRSSTRELNSCLNHHNLARNSKFPCQFLASRQSASRSLSLFLDAHHFNTHTKN